MDIYGKLLAMSTPPINKYTVSSNEEEGEVLPNLLGITTAKEIAEAEFMGFVEANKKAIDELSDDTRFNLEYLYTLHKNALGHLYSFAGKLRTVNMSKDNFSFPPASFLVQSICDFEVDFLTPLKNISDDALLIQLARMHAELLFIHPFREGNGRTIRLFTNMIFLSKTGKEFDFAILDKNLKTYIAAVQQAAQKEYKLMENLFLQMTDSL